MIVQTAFRDFGRFFRLRFWCGGPQVVLAVVLAFLPISASPSALASAPNTRPNIIMIMADDMGWSDLGCFGSEIQTPNLDALAAGGVRFTQFYNTARCCPTRATLLTGLYAHQAGIGHMMEDRGLDAYRGDLNDRCVTIAEVLKTAGYRTYMAGKWHVTKKVRPRGEQDRSNWPLQRGFDRFYGTIHGAGSFFDPNSLVRDNTLISPYADSEYQPKEFYYTDAINDHAARFVKEHARQHADQPFVMYVAHTAPHWPMHAKPADIEKYKGHYDKGYDAIRAARHERMKSLGLIDPAWKLAAQDGGAWDDVKDRAFELRCMEVFAAMIDCLDQGVGRLVQELKQTNQWDNTLILFFQDNGGCAEGMGRGGKVPGKRSAAPTLPPLAADYLQPDMIPRQTRDGFPMRQGYGVLPGAADTYHGYGRSWANVSNTPFREYKHWVHEGGISTPLIAHWPNGIPTSRHNSLESQPAHLIDLMATCVALSDAQYPVQFRGNDIHPLEGVNLTPAFSGESLNRQQPIFWEHEGNRAIRDGNWKLVSKHPQGWELFDMQQDRTEQHDVATAHPEQVQRLSHLWQAWADRVGVAEWPLPRKKRQPVEKKNSRANKRKPNRGGNR